MNTKIENRNTGITHRRLTDNRCSVRRPLPGSGIVAAGGTSADSRAARPPDAGRTRQPHRSAGRILSLLLALPLFFGLASQAMAQELMIPLTGTPIAITSTGPYAIGEAIAVTVSFSETATVDITGGTPQITLMVGTNDREAIYASGSGNTDLVFTYAVQASDTNGAQVSIAANMLALNSGTIQDADGNNAVLTHPAVPADSAHTVDTVVPILDSASVSANNIVLTYSEILDRTSPPANDDYTIMVTDTATPSPTVPTVNDPVVINGANVMLTLSRNITTTETVRLTYTPGTNPLRDVAGNNAGSLMDEGVERPSQGPMFDDMVDDPQTYTVGTPVDLTLPTAMASSSEGVDYDLVGPDATLVDNDLPAGLTFNMALRTLSGTPTTAMDEVMLTYTADSSGRSTSLTFTVIVVAAAAASVTVTETDSDTTVAENDGTDTYTVVLGSRPTADVTITPVSGDTTVAMVSSPLTFTTANWNAAQTVTVTGVNDDIVNPMPRTATVSHTIAGGGYDSVGVDDVAVNVTDDDTAVVTISETALTVDPEAGGTNTYTVVLRSQPTANVVITPVSGDTTVAMVSSPLTFTTANWNAAQTVTVTGVNDDIVNPIDRTATVTHTIAGGGYDSVSVADVTVTATDDDTAVVTISETALTVDPEAGGTNTYTVVLRSQPTANVVITPVSGDTTVAMVSSPLTFTTANWNAAQTVTVTGVNDDIVNPIDRTATVTHTITGGGYDSVSVADVTVTATDDDTAVVTISETALTVDPEAGGTNTYTVVLRSQPTANVVITPVSGDTTVAMVSSPLTFTTANWNAAQTVTVTGVNDDIVNPIDRTATVTHTITGGGYDSVSVADVTVTATDDDTAVVTISETALTVDPEAGGTNTYTVVLRSQPTANVVITPVSGDTTVAMVSSPLTFTTANWNAAQTVTVTGVNDDIVNPIDRTATVTHTITGGGYDSVSVADVTVTATDDDTAVVTISETALTVDPEAGGTNTYTVVLGSRPTANVVITPVSGDTTVAMVSSPLTFTTANWNAAQTVTVTGVNDDIVNPIDRTATVTHTITGGGYDSVSVADVTVTATDDDTAVVTISETALTVDPEAGGTNTYTVVLGSRPTANVVITPVSGDTTVAMVSSPLTFTTANWNAAQTVTVTGVNDDIVNPIDRTATVTHTITGGGYDSVSVADVTVTATDDDTAVVTISETALTVDPEAGGTNTYTVVLRSQPTANVVITPVSGDTTVAMVSSPLTFTTANWNAAQTVTVTGVNDNIDNVGDARTVMVTHTATSSDLNYDRATTSRPIASTTVTITDDDDAPARLAALNEAILPEVIRSMTDSTVNAITQRIKQSTAPGPKAATLTLNGRAMSLADLTPTDNLSGVADNPSVAGMLTGIARSVADDSWQLGRALGNSSFMLPTDSDLAELTLWGGGDYRELSGESGALDWDGDLGSGILGADTPVSDTLLVGLAVSWQSGDFDYKEVTADAAHSGDYEVNQFSAQPYIGWSSPDGRQDLWATAGYGWGDVEIDDQAMGRQSSNLNTQNVGVGGSGQLLQSGASTLRLKGQFHQTWAEVEGNNDLLRKLNLDVRRLRLALEGTHEQPLANGAQLTPTVEVGLRYDAGDGPTGSGIEVGAGLRFTAPAIGLSAEGRGRVLLAHSGDYDDWGLNGTLRFAPQSNGRGLAFSLQPAYGATASRVTHLWEQDSVVSPTADAPHGARMDADLSYGLDWAEALVTPYVRLSLAGSQTYRIGSRLQLHDGLALSLEGLRQEADTRSVEHGILLKLKLDW